MINSLNTLSKNIESIYPLAPIQQGMLFHTLMQPNSGIYLQQYRYVMTMDNLNLSAFKKAWQSIVDRHQILRTAFIHESQEQALQVVLKQVELPFEFLDWRHLSAQEQSENVEQLLADERLQGLAFNKAPLMHIRLIQLADNRYQFVRSYHHILMDAWCFSLIMVEFLQFYRHYSEGQPLALSPAPQYQDYIAWLLKRDEQATQYFWQQKLAGFDQVSSLGIEQSNRYLVESERLNASLSKDVICQFNAQQTARLQHIAQQYQVTLNTLLQGAWAQTLARYSQQQDVVFGVTVAGRSIELTGIEKMVGLFINTLPLRCQVTPEQSLASWLQNLQQENLALRDYEQSSLALIQQWSEIQEQPLFNSIFVYENTPMDKALDLDKLEFSVDDAQNRSDLNYPLTVTVLTHENLQLELTYRSSDFEHSAVAEMLAHFQQLLLNILKAEAPTETPTETKLRDIEPSYSLTAPEQHKVLIGEHVDLANQANTLATELFSQQVINQPQAIALRDSNQVLTYAELDQQSSALAHYLIDNYQVKPEQLIGLCINPCPQMLVAIFAILKAGAAYVPLDPNYPIARLNYMVDDAKLSVILGQQALTSHALFLQAPEKLVSIDSAEIKQALANTAQNIQPPQVQLNGSQLAYVIYTSGTTGNPKGVMVEHQQLGNFLVNAKQRYQITPNDKVLQFSTINFDISVEECFGALCFGAELVIRDNDIISDPAKFFQFINHYDVSIVSLPTAYWHQLVSYPQQETASNLKLVIVGGEALQLSLVNQWFEHYQNTELVNTYGPTEGTVTACGYHLKQAYQESGEIPIGQANINTQLYILDAQLRQVPFGTIGELYIGGHSVARGYLNQPELTAERFIASPFDNTQRLYRTGDLVRLNHQGELEFNGRIDDQVKIRGYRIELAEIETVLQQLPDIQQCIVTTWQPDNATKALVAYFTAEQTLNTAQLRQQLANKLADYMVPSALIQLEQLPLTANGKVNKKALPTPQQQTSNNSEQTTYVAATNETEQLIVDSWQRILGVEQVSIDDNFFKLGGHSLLVIQVLGALRKQDLPLEASQLFQYPTPRALAAVVQQNKQANNQCQLSQQMAHLIPENSEAITPDMLPLLNSDQSQLNNIVEKSGLATQAIQDIYPLAPLQEGILFHHMLAPNNDPYIVKALLEIKDSHTFDRFVNGLNFVIQRHDVLRTAILWRELDKPVQLVHRQAQLQVNWLDLDELLPETEQHTNICQRMLAYQQSVTATLDLERAPLIQLCVAKDQQTDKHAVMFIEHHIISDHMGVEIIIKELMAYLNNETEQLLPQVPYRHFVAATLQQDQQLAQQYFTEQLANITRPTLPYQLDNTQGSGADVIHHKHQLPTQLAETIRAVSKHYNTSPASFFHCAWALVVARASAYSEITFGTVMSGRLSQLSNDVDNTQAMLGMFINTLPVCINITNISAEQLLQRVQQKLQSLIPYEQSSLALAQRCSQVSGQQALFSALVNYRHSTSPANMEAQQTLTGVKLLNVNEPSNYPFTLSVDDYGSDFSITLEIDKSLACQQVEQELLSAINVLVAELKPAQGQNVSDDILQSYLQYQAEQTLEIQWQQPATMKFAQPVSKSVNKPLNITAEVSDKEAPQTQYEQTLAEIWQQILFIDNIGRQDDFFALGGHSLLIMQMLTALQQQNINLNASQVFKTPVLADLALALEQHNLQSTDSGDTSLAAESLIPTTADKITPDMLPLISLAQADIDDIVSRVPRGVNNIQDIYPLAPLQEGILFHHCMSPENDPYVMPAYLEINGSRNFELFIDALKQIINRHDTLRTAILWRNLTTPVQVVYRQAELNMTKLELDNSGDLLAQMQQLDEHQLLSVDIEKAPLFNITFAHQPEDDQYVIRMLDHHIISDHVSMAILQQELALIVTEQPLPQPVQYRQFITQLVEQQADQQVTAKAFFGQQLAGFTEPSLPFAVKQLTTGDLSINEQDTWLPAELNQQVRQTAQQLKTNPATLFHCAYAMVIAACSNKEDIVFGTVMSGRMQGIAGTESMMGMFINTLPLRLQLNNITAMQLVEQTQQALLQLIPYEQTPLAEVQQASETFAQTSNDLPLFSALLNYRHTDKKDEQADHALSQLTFIDPKERTNYPITVSIDDYNDDFLINCQTDPSISAKAVSEYFVMALTQLSAQLTVQLSAQLFDHSSQTILQSSVVPADEQQRLLALNSYQADYPKDQCVYHQLEQQAVNSAQQTALVFNNESLSYQVFNEQVNQLANYLIENGVSEGCNVALCLDRSFDMVIAIWAILKAGGAYLPIDNSLPKARIKHMLDNSKAKFVLTQQHLVSLIETKVQTLVLDNSAHQALLNALPKHNPQRDTNQSPLSSAYLIYTSGSTGEPKGVVCTHQGLMNRVDWMQRQYQLTAKDRVLQKTPYSFDVSVWEFVWPLVTGATLVIAKPDGHRDAQYLQQLIVQQGVTHLHFVPSMLSIMLSDSDWQQCNSVQKVFCSGEALSIELQNNFFATKTKAELHNLYGPTEAAIDVSYWQCQPNSTLKTVPIGKPIQNTQLIVLDKYQKLVPFGAEGELYIGGDNLAQGYLNKPELTNERFIDIAIAEQAAQRLYRTGDLVRYLASGDIEYIGRIDHQVKIRGLRIELGEIEYQLNQYPDIQVAHVAVKQSAQQEQHLVAYIEAETDVTDKDTFFAQIKQYLQGQLPLYMVPNLYLLVSEWPLSANGKINKKALPDPDFTISKEDFVDATTTEQVKLVAIWSELLGLSEDNISITSNFFELGGHSILAMKLISAVEAEFDLSLSLQRLFSSPTISTIAEQIVTHQSQQTEELDIMEQLLNEFEEQE